VPAIGFTEAVDVLGLIAWLMRDQFIASIEHEIDAASDDKAALSRDERERQEAAIMADVLQTERCEGALIWHAEAQGEMIDFRSTTSPQSVLGIKLVNAPRRAPKYDGHSWDVAGR
jgi:hypothetical protein